MRYKVEQIRFKVESSASADSLPTLWLGDQQTSVTEMLEVITNKINELIESLGG
jgi:hypothetical protein